MRGADMPQVGTSLHYCLYLLTGQIGSLRGKQAAVFILETGRMELCTHVLWYNLSLHDPCS